ncbi:MAG: DUF3386 domain-containing protein [Oscillatoriales cyanobacterium SM2_2_1]|nr:DUF3386 domain-containing protein [Oscillatoriales cyanobacterium SM2_2_1]
MVPSVQTSLSAQELFQEAYEHRYTWDREFPGFTAAVTLIQGEQTTKAQAQVTPDLKVVISDSNHGEGEKAIFEQLREVIIHRVRRSFAEVHGKNTFAFGECLSDGTVEIVVDGAATGDRYRVRDRIITMVHRHIHSMVVTIHTLTYKNTPLGYLPEIYESTYSNPSTGETQNEKTVHEDHYIQVDGYYILSDRTQRYAPSDQPYSHLILANVRLIA